MKLKVAIFNMAIALFLFSCDGGTRTADEADGTGTFDTDLTDNQWDNERRSEFVKTAANINMKDIRAGEIAQNKAKDQSVKDYGQMLVNDHRDAQQKLQNAAQKENINVPQNLDEKHQEKVKELEQASAGDFRKKFLDMMVQGHEDAISKFEDAQKNLQSGELKTWVDNTLPALKKHRDRAKQLQEQNK